MAVGKDRGDHASAEAAAVLELARQIIDVPDDGSAVSTEGIYGKVREALAVRCALQQLRRSAARLCKPQPHLQLWYPDRARGAQSKRYLPSSRCMMTA
jgi:hypothetical protein